MHAEKRGKPRGIPCRISATVTEIGNYLQISILDILKKTWTHYQNPPQSSLSVHIPQHAQHRLTPSRLWVLARHAGGPGGSGFYRHAQPSVLPVGSLTQPPPPAEGRAGNQFILPQLTTGAAPPGRAGTEGAQPQPPAALDGPPGRLLQPRPLCNQPVAVKT